MNIESTFTQESQARPGVRFTMRVLNQYQRALRDSKIIDARVQVSELSRQLHAIPDPDAEIDEIRARAKKEDREVTRRMSKGLAFLISYSFQKTLTNTDSASVYSGGYAQDVNNRGLEKSVAAFNHPQNLKLTWIYELPFGKGHPFLNKGGIVNQILGGWTLTGNQQYESGNPLSISSGLDASSYLFNGSVRANVISGQPLTVPMTGHLDVATGVGGVQYLNPNAFALPPTSPGGVILSLGNSPRYFSNLRGPFRPSESFGIFKRFHLGESRFVEIRGDAFNAFNRAGLGDPVTTLGDPMFGKIIDVQQTPREIQVAARLTF